MNTQLVKTALLCASLGLYAQIGYSVELKTDQDQLNYAVGHQIGGDFKTHGVELKEQSLVQGVQDAMNGSKPLLSQEEMEKILVDFKNKIEAHHHAEIKKTVTSTAQSDIAQGRVFLAENAKNPGVTVLPSGLQYKVLETGKSKQPGSPKDDSKVTINYQGSLIGGRLFTTSYKDGKTTPQTYALTDLVPGGAGGLEDDEARRQMATVRAFGTELSSRKGTDGDASDDLRSGTGGFQIIGHHSNLEPGSRCRVCPVDPCYGIELPGQEFVDQVVDAPVFIN